MIDVARYGFVAAWSVPVVVLFASFTRCAIGRGKGRDRIRSATWFAAAVMLGFAVRWLAYPHPELAMPDDEASFWAGLYLAGMFAAIRLLSATWADDT